MGCAGLSLAVRLSEAGLTKDKKILLVDREIKNRNDRTWCFWETQPGFFEDIVFRSWNKAWFNSNDLTELLDLAPYKYKMIRGIDFFDHCMKRISADPAFDIKYGVVKDIYTEEFMAFLLLEEEEFGAPIHVLQSDRGKEFIGCKELFRKKNKNWFWHQEIGLHDHRLLFFWFIALKQKIK
jgi:hypothetical protein